MTYREGRVTVLRERDHEAFLRALAASAEPPAAAAPLEDVFYIRRPSGKTAYAVRVHRLPGWDRLLGLGVQAVEWFQITDPAEAPRDLTETLRRLYHGPCPRTRRRRRQNGIQVTQNTIRTQLKSVLAKTGVRRQVDLVLLVNRLAAAA